MKTKFLATAISMLLACGTMSYAVGPQDPAPNGSAQSQDSKNQENLPPGTKAQTPSANPTKDSKKDATIANPTAQSETIPGALPASKTPQKDKEQR